MRRHALVETPATPVQRPAWERMGEMHDLIELIARWSDDIRQLATGTPIQRLEFGAKVQKVFEMKGRLKVVTGGRSRRRKPEER